MDIESSQIQKYSKLIADLNDKIENMSAAQRVSQFGYTSIENSHVNVYDALGQARSRIGKQDDGKFAVKYYNGDNPPLPSQPVVIAKQLSAVISHDGSFANGKATPSDLERFDVHVSKSAQFVPDGTTIFGDLPASGGAVSVVLDNTTHYVKVVAVSSSNVPSAPTDAESVLPYPATEIAAGSIGANELASNIVLTTTITAGDPGASHIQIDPSGLHGFNDYLNETLSFDTATGNAVIVGTIKTSNSGPRIIFNEDPGGANVADQKIGFYGTDPNKELYIGMQETVVGAITYPQLEIVAPNTQSTRSPKADLSSFFAISASEMFYGFYNSDQTLYISQFTISDYNFYFHLTDPDGYTNPWWEPEITANINPDSPEYMLMTFQYTKYEASVGNFSHGLRVSSPTVTSGPTAGIVLYAPYVNIWNQLQTDGAPVWAKSYNVHSDSQLKYDISEPNDSMLELVKSVPAKQWKFKAGGSDQIHCGPLADDLPEWAIQLHHKAKIDGIDGDDDPYLKGYDLGTIIGIIWGAVRELANG